MARLRLPPTPSRSVNWSGFYIRDDKFPALASAVSSPPLPDTPHGDGSSNGVTISTISTTYATPEEQYLLLGPFHGKPACQQIRFGKGVCGTAASKQMTMLVPDVLNFPGHIACDADSRSEIVVPILVRGEVGLLLYGRGESVLTNFLLLDCRDYRHRLHRAIGLR